jgi:site-specific DNA recombinase
MDKSGFQLSSPSLLSDQPLEIISNLSEFWASGDYDHKRKLQELLFPGGILFDKQIDNYRTPNVNSILSLTRSISNSISENKNGQIRNLSDLPGLVVPTGIEPVSKV